MNKKKKYECPVCGPQEKPCSEMAAELNNALAPTAFAEWYALHGIPLGIGRDNARVIYEAANSQKVLELDQAYDLQEKLRETIKRIELTFSMLYDKWLSAGHRRDMNEAMELMARELGSPICPDCKCELVKPGNTCSQCDRPPDAAQANCYVVRVQGEAYKNASHEDKSTQSFPFQRSRSSKAAEQPEMEDSGSTPDANTISVSQFQKFLERSSRWFRALQRELDDCKAQRDRLLAACKLVMDYEAIHLNGGIGYCIAIKTSALNAVLLIVREVETPPTPEITDNLP